MEVTAYILIETRVGKAAEVIAELMKLKAIKAAHFVAGPYDVIAVAELADLIELNSLISSNIHSIQGINKTVSCLVMDNPSIMETTM